VIKRKICEGTDCLNATLSSGMTPTGDGYLSKKCGLGEEWSNNIPLSHTLSKGPYEQYANTRFRNISDQHHCPQSTLT